MHITITTILTRIFINSIILFFQFLLLKHLNKNKFINSKMLKTMSLLFIAILIFPVEFDYTISIPSKIILPSIQNFLNYKIVIFGNSGISVFNLILLIWLLGTTVKLIYLLSNYLKLKRFAQTCSDESVEIKANNKKKKLKIINVNTKCSPSVIGLLKPTILLPNINLTTEELNYILKHECIHVLNLDLLVKYIYEIVLAFYWWNPVAYFFRKQMNQILELQVDENIVYNLQDEERIKYAETLLKISKELQIKKENPFSISLTTISRDLLLQRTRNILKTTTDIKKKNPILYLICFLFCFFIASSIVFEPYLVNPEIEETTFQITKENSYLIENDDGKYQLYSNGVYMTTLETIDNDENLKKLKIYNSEDM
ncbi:conserved membrane hypothetical protein [Carnobacterium maltaromaticum]|uniref:M56 family metallopeptidase n=1 Tax=Carnobacterium maltaromaticum TaxID=2751 RepID=UPI00191BC6A2|nr:M56 family metallopeptidase [Carnobacterium maltaromaticum]CAD5902055.1 conserved membrane hypothetical protein [Carnobacterium maltaromaticum]